MHAVLKRRLLWVGGKGGVGKTTVAASLAVLAASRGKRVLVVSTDPAHSLGDVFDRQLGDTPRRLLPNLDAMEIDPDREVEAHLARVVAQMRRYAAPEMMQELERQMRLTRQSPGTQEAALLERLVFTPGRNAKIALLRRWVEQGAPWSPHRRPAGRRALQGRCPGAPCRGGRSSS